MSCGARTHQRSPRKGLQVQVSRLRKALEEGSARLVTQPNGYLLHVEPGELDLDRCERLAHDGREALSTEDPRRAADRLQEALAVWRGPALVDFSFESFAQGEIGRLEELRLALLEDRIDADLACGRHTELVGELEALVTEHPLRERLRRQLVLALYRGGRQAEALEAYRAAREILDEELGLEPTPAPGPSSRQSSPMTRTSPPRPLLVVRSADCRPRRHPPSAATRTASPSQSYFTRRTTAS